MRIGWTMEASGEVAELSNDTQQDPDQDKLDGLTDVNSEPDFGAGATQAALYTWSANSDELATEPLGYDDNDMDDFNTGTTGPTVTQTDIDPDNSYSGSRHPQTFVDDVPYSRPTDTELFGQAGLLPPLASVEDADLIDLFGSEYVPPSDVRTAASAPSNQGTRPDGILHVVGMGTGTEMRNKVDAEPTMARVSDLQVAGITYEGDVRPSVGMDHLGAVPESTVPVVIRGGGPVPTLVIPGSGDLRPEAVLDSHMTQYSTRKLASGIVVEGSWSDVQSKAQRIYKDGGVRIISVTGPYIAGNVKGSEGVYETTLQRGQTGSIDQWTCSCPWFAYSFGRSGRWKKYEGRMCSHALALQYKAQSEGIFGREIKEDTQSPGWDNEITHYTPPPPKEWRASFDPLLVADDSTDGAMVHTELPTPATRVASRFYLAEEARDEDGKWTSGMGEVTPKGYGKITPGEARGDSKKVTTQEFDDLADKGKQKYDSLLADKRQTTAFDDADKWATIRSGAYDAAQKKWGGQTLDPATGRAIERSKGFSLEVRAPGEKQLSVSEDADEDTFNAMMDRAKEEYADKLQGSEVYLGVFRDDDNHRIDFDPVTIVGTEEEVDALGAYTHAVGGAYNFSTGNGHFPPHVASLASDVKESVLMWSTIKVNNQKAVPNPEHDGFRYAFHQILGDVGAFRYNASNPDFMKGEHLATVFLKAFMDNQVPSHRPLYRAIGLHPDDYMTILTSCQSGSIDLPPASWSANKALTEQFGLDYMQGTKKYEERIIFVTRPGSTSWALGRTSNTSYEREHIVGGRFHVVSIKFPPETDNTTIITLQETEGWPEDFASTGDMIEHMAFDSAVVSPQDSKTARYLTIDEARAGAFDYSIPMTAADHVDPHKGTMIAVRPPESVCQELALDTETAEDPEAVAQLHVTLAYLSPEESADLDLDLLRQVVEAQSQLSPYIPATLSGHGTFENPDGDVSVVLVDSEELHVARALLVAALERAGIEVSREHSFTPHITLTYGDPGDLDPVDKQPFYFTEFIISPPSGEWEHYELATNISLAASVVVADQENPIPPTHNAEPSWGSTPISQDDPTGSPLDSDGEPDSVLPGAQAVLDEEPEGALPSTDGDTGSDGAQSDQDYYPTDEQINSKPYGGEGAAPTTIAWLAPSRSNEVVKGGDMDIAKAAKDYLMTSEAVKTFSFAEQAEIVNEGEGVVASNLDRLDLRGTHYEALEAQLARAEAIGEPVYWWDE
jgi:2'-5' RNA ligase